ncbi:FIST signal transduction protein [Ectothiorhodospira shaposhnikovii]|uniref:FIST signal transduction protein n=1 Tax=Ectothiorhodospira shaposhnikovii TaxID=1054 RepID=UPI001EE84740|nr:FIST C-terminal domain-containing protein [Ectothiorhodospira shaposhnikovii]MCG5512763.1 FIST C-terminal domain-containing protein [Ectothiorhodospira shaposhnikovii]
MIGALFDKTGTLTGMAHLMKAASNMPGCAGLMVLACVDNVWTPPRLEALMRAQRLPVFGGIFPGLLYEGQRFERGTIVVALSQAPTMVVVPDLAAASEQSIALSLEGAFTCHQEQDAVMVVLVNGFSSHISKLISGVFDGMGLSCNYLGGGAGNLSCPETPCLFTGDGLLKDGAIMALMNLKSGIGVSHGWRSISSPVKVSKSLRNRVLSLNSRPALDVYAELIAAHSGVRIRADNFFDVAKGYPLGICRLRGEFVVRDPLSLDEEGALVCVGDVPEGGYVEILHGDVRDLTQAADSVVKAAERLYPGQGLPALGFVCDCISRSLYLQDKFPSELRKMQRDYPMVGILSIGEIANNGQECLEFYNKTIVLGLLGSQH